MLNFFRYFFVIDDIWDDSVWEIIHCVFPENQKGSQVITTTRLETVANASCNYQHEFVYKMSPLDDQNSRKLFFSRVGQNDSLYIFILTKLKKIDTWVN